MRWQGKEKSKNVEDRRGQTMRRVGGGIGISTIIMIGLALLSGQDLGSVLMQVFQQQAQTQTQTQTTNEPRSAEEDELAEFVSVVLKQTEDVWQRLFKEQIGKQYQEPNLVLFTGAVQSACGNASAATGPFYCPADYKLYIDLGFYQQLKQQFKVSGDFAMAYVVAHEVAHHVQNLLGISDQVSAQRGRISQTEYNELSVKLELQADFLAGVWAHYAQEMNNILEEGDIEEALNAAHAIGDDNIQKKTQGYVVPDAFTHGTSEQRVRWFKKGFDTGDLNQGDTFGARSL
ncbi:MAG: neutral zinc metallopeptidase [Chitinophagales bacterium]